ncbi:MAG: hypothetical protein IKR07_01280 [Oscillospiraceae bacterium]|nr:hypothetical protein [Oscillospiraceae bacterium]
MKAIKRLPSVRLFAVSLALLLLTAAAIGTRADALTIQDSGSDAVTSATPVPDSSLPPQAEGQTPPQFAEGTRPQFPDGTQPQLPDGQTMPVRPDGEQRQFRSFPSEDGSGAALQFPGKKSIDGESGGRTLMIGQGADGAGLEQNGVLARQTSPILWALVGFSTALVLTGAGFGIAAIVRHRKARKEAVVEIEP